MLVPLESGSGVVVDRTGATLTIDEQPSVGARVVFAVVATLGALLVVAALRQVDGWATLGGAAIGAVFAAVGLFGFGFRVTHRIDRNGGAVERVRRWMGIGVGAWRGAIDAHTSVVVRPLPLRDRVVYDVRLRTSGGETLLAQAPTEPGAQQLAQCVRDHLGASR